MGGKDKKKPPPSSRKGATFHAVHMTDVPDGKQRKTKQKKSKTVHVVNVVEPVEKKKRKTQKRAVLLALIVRLLMVIHNLLTAWRVVMMYEDNMYWILAAGNALMFLEGFVVIKMRGGVEYSWWCPCFAAYLISTLPGIWLIQLHQNTFQEVETVQNVTMENVNDVITDIAAALSVNNNGTISMAALMANISKLNVVPADTITFTDVTNGSVTLTTAYPNIVNDVTASFVNVTSSGMNATTPTINSATTTLASVTDQMVTPLTNVTSFNNVSDTISTQLSNFTTSVANVSSDITTQHPRLTTLMTDAVENVTTPMVNVTGKPTFLTIMRMLDNDVWIIIIQEGLVYALILGRWMLPQSEFSRDYLADLLLEFLGIASDIMELLAVFDDDVPTFLTIMRMLDNDVWIIIIQEGLVYALILGRWMLPQSEFSRDYLADLLLEFLGIASDIMELLAVFDDDVVFFSVVFQPMHVAIIWILINDVGMPTFLTIMRMLDNDVWIIIIQEGLVYALILGRWMLPQSEFSRDYLADLLLEFLGIASDIMELLAVFDDDVVRADKELTYIILGVWSASFIQFIPIVTHRRRFRRVDYAKRKKPYCRCCGEKCVEVAATGMSIFLQDGPFLGLRLYIMIYKKLVTYSLVFFVLKNIVTLMLLFYRLFVLCCSMPCCYDRKNRVQGVELVDYQGQPVSQAEMMALQE